MSRICDLSWKKPVFGNNRSNSNQKTQKIFFPNLHDTRVYSHHLSIWISLRLSANGMRTLDKHGGIDEYLKNKTYRKLSPKLQNFKKKLEKKGFFSEKIQKVKKTV